jgi:hypothetical protein
MTAHSRSLQQTVPGADFNMKLCTFSTNSPLYLNTVYLDYNYDITFSELMKDLQSWTSTLTIPPPLPLNLDPDYKYPAHFEYGMAVLNRQPKEKKGYTIEDGAWAWTMSEVKIVDGKRSWVRIGHGTLRSRGDMLTMFHSMKLGLNGRKFQSCRVLVMIHVRTRRMLLHTDADQRQSQDQIAMHRWQHSDHHIKKNIDNFNVQWSVEDAERLDKYLRTPPTSDSEQRSKQNCRP